MKHTKKYPIGFILKWKNHERGFSLVEVTASLLIITIIGFSFMGILYQAMSNSSFSSERLSAVHFAKLVLDYYKANPAELDHIPAGNEVPPTTFTQSKPLPYNPSSYRVLVIPQEKTAEGLTPVEVTVLWTDHQVSMTGYVEKGE
ncbi:type IV pilus modification PilV family protein [Thermicanus aegyptius]|uniref:type IV pilus modification PilV family protein n=1 Tax=Thermicanus aegyptius TaxID=94009 RepID=UPI0003FF98A0|nr:prepilin-type N-terminal cleavage/methylation domain-containing protein [Thermicanus aegyptius]